MAIKLIQQKWYFLVVFLIIFPLFYVYFSYAQQDQPKNIQMVRKTILDFKDELALNPEQIEKIKVYISDFEKSAKPLREKIVVLDRETRELLDKGGEINEIRKKIKESFSLRADILIMDIEAGSKIERVLTPEQLSKWKEIKKLTTRK